MKSNQIKCDKCGRFIPHVQFEKNGGASSVFVPDSEVSYEEIGYRCKGCTLKHGNISSHQFPLCNNSKVY